MGQRDNRDRVQRLTLSGILLGVMLVLGAVEHALPSFTLPGVKLGLSNSVLIFAVYMLDLPAAWILMALKVTLSGFLFGNLSAMMYAFAGGVLSMLAMSLLSRIRKLPVVAVSMAGGVMHNVGQVLAAMMILKTPGLLYYMIPLSGAGIACGALTGVAATLVLKHVKQALRLKPQQANDKRFLLILTVIILLAAAIIAWQSLPDVSAATTEVMIE
ncbi:MAG: Gx transporter family protein [Clostridia bacterium]|nr:Gx transporter family protein [Clostridia bacterium]